MKPIKSAAVFWYNLYRNGNGNVLTEHAACPVLKGTKWGKNRNRKRQKNRKIERQKDRKTERQRDRETERQKDRKTERQKERKTERQKDRKTERTERTERLWMYSHRMQPFPF